MEEIWRDIAGYEGYYQVSNMGNVRSMDRHIQGNNNHIIGTILKPLKTNGGYFRVALCRDNKKKYCSIHRLVMYAFTGKIPRGMEVNHSHGIKSDNRLSELELCTKSENELHAHRIGLKHAPNRRAVCKKTKEGEFLRRYNSLREAFNDTGISDLGISLCARGIRHSAGGFLWEWE